MKRFAIFVIGVFIAFCPALVTADPSIPKIDGWNVVGMSRIELRVTDETVVYLGFIVEYSNPNDSREFVRVTRRHIPLPISKPKLTDGRFSEASIATYVQKEEQDLLTAKTLESDPIIYIQWRTKENQRTKRDMLDGDVNIHFMSPDGNWHFSLNDKEVVEFLTENVVNGETHNVFSGMMYKVKDYYHILRVDRDVLAKLLEGGK